MAAPSCGLLFVAAGAELGFGAGTALCCGAGTEVGFGAGGVALAVAGTTSAGGGVTGGAVAVFSSAWTGDIDDGVTGLTSSAAISSEMPASREVRLVITVRSPMCSEPPREEEMLWIIVLLMGVGWVGGQVRLTPVVEVQVSVPRWKVWVQRVVVGQVWLVVG